jgi:hypothetical protein
LYTDREPDIVVPGAFTIAANAFHDFGGDDWRRNRLSRMQHKQPWRAAAAGLSQGPTDNQI